MAGGVHTAHRLTRTQRHEIHTYKNCNYFIWHRVIYIGIYPAVHWPCNVVKAFGFEQCSIWKHHYQAVSLLAFGVLVKQEVYLVSLLIIRFSQ